MPKPKANIDEPMLIELVKNNPELYDCTQSQSDDPGHVDAIWEEIADKLHAPTDAVKRTWKNIQQRYNRRSSLRKLPDENLSFLCKTSMDVYSNENSCASSNCSSPKGDTKRSVRSISQLSTASEAERSLSSLMASTKATLRKFDDSKEMKTKDSPLEDPPTPAQGRPLEIKLNKKQRQNSMERGGRARFSEPSHLASKEVLQNDVTLANDLGLVPKRLSGTPNMKNKMKKTLTASDPTRVFFESMAMTVATFPQHIQATIKLQICNIITETEYGLSKGC